MSLSKLGALIHLKPDEAKQRILVALEEAKGDRSVAAKLLGTTHRSFYRFIERLKLWPDIDRIMRENGFTKIPGPQRTASRIRTALLAAEGDLGQAAKDMGIRVESVRARIEELNLRGPLNVALKNAGFRQLEKFQ